MPLLITPLSPLKPIGKSPFQLKKVIYVILGVCILHHYHLFKNTYIAVFYKDADSIDSAATTGMRINVVNPQSRNVYFSCRDRYRLICDVFKWNGFFDFTRNLVF